MEGQAPAASAQQQQAAAHPTMQGAVVSHTTHGSQPSGQALESVPNTAVDVPLLTHPPSSSPEDLQITLTDSSSQLQEGLHTEAFYDQSAMDATRAHLESHGTCQGRAHSHGHGHMDRGCSGIIGWALGSTQGRKRARRDSVTEQQDQAQLQQLRTAEVTGQHEALRQQLAAAEGKLLQKDEELRWLKHQAGQMATGQKEAATARASESLRLHAQIMRAQQKLQKALADTQHWEEQAQELEYEALCKMQEHEHELLAMHKKLEAAKKQAAAAAAASSAAACADHAGASKASLAPEVLALSRHQYPACADAATASRAAVQMLQPSPMLFNPDLPHGFDADAMRVELEIFTEALRQAMALLEVHSSHLAAAAISMTPAWQQPQQAASLTTALGPGPILQHVLLAWLWRAVWRNPLAALGMDVRSMGGMHMQLEDALSAWSSNAKAGNCCTSSSSSSTYTAVPPPAKAGNEPAVQSLPSLLVPVLATTAAALSSSLSHQWLHILNFMPPVPHGPEQAGAEYERSQTPGAASASVLGQRHPQPVLLEHAQLHNCMQRLEGQLSSFLNRLADAGSYAHGGTDAKSGPSGSNSDGVSSSSELSTVPVGWCGGLLHAALRLGLFVHAASPLLRLQVSGPCMHTMERMSGEAMRMQTALGAMHGDAAQQSSIQHAATQPQSRGLPLLYSSGSVPSVSYAFHCALHTLPMPAHPPSVVPATVATKSACPILSSAAGSAGEACAACGREGLMRPPPPRVLLCMRPGVVRMRHLPGDLLTAAFSNGDGEYRPGITLLAGEGGLLPLAPELMHAVVPEDVIAVQWQQPAHQLTPEGAEADQPPEVEESLTVTSSQLRGPSSPVGEERAGVAYGPQTDPAWKLDTLCTPCIRQQEGLDLQAPTQHAAATGMQTCQRLHASEDTLEHSTGVEAPDAGGDARGDAAVKSCPDTYQQQMAAEMQSQMSSLSLSGPVRDTAAADAGGPATAASSKAEPATAASSKAEPATAASSKAEPATATDTVGMSTATATLPTPATHG